MAALRQVSVEQQNILREATKERAEIVAKYDKGREEGAVIDPWEDPDLPLYHVTDRYGFIHETKLSPTKSAEEAKAIETEMRRTDKWLSMLKKWKKFSTGSKEKLKERVYKGIPDKIRGQAWSYLLEIDERKNTQRGIYEKMKQRAREWSPDLRQIDLDVNRTYRDHMMFRRRYDVKQQELFNVLAAYSMYNTEVGYCQGMSQIAALLLMYMQEEDSFWALSELMTNRRHAMHGFFIPHFPKLMRFQEHFDFLLKKYHPKLKKHMDDLDIITSLYSVKWFLQCFLDRVPFPMTLRLWDIYMLEGEKLLLAMSLTIMKLHYRRLIKLDMEGLVKVLQVQLEKDFGYSDSVVFATLQQVMVTLERDKVALPPMSREARDLESPTKPFGLFVPTSVEQLIGRRTLETEIELLTGRHSVLNPSALLGYPDRGPSLQHVHNRMSVLITANKLKRSSVDDDLDATAEVDETKSSRSSMALDLVSSRTSLASQTSDDASTLTGGSRLQLSQLDSHQNSVVSEGCGDPLSLTSGYNSVDSTELRLSRNERKIEKSPSGNTSLDDAFINEQLNNNNNSYNSGAAESSVFGINGHRAGAKSPANPDSSRSSQGAPVNNSPAGKTPNGKSANDKNGFSSSTSRQSQQRHTLLNSVPSDFERTTNL